MSEAEQTLPNPNMEGPPADSGREVRISPGSLAKHYEADDVQARPIIWFTVGVMVTITLGLLVMWWFVGRWIGDPVNVQVQIPSADVMPPSVPGPGLQAAPEVDMSLLLERENVRLSDYRWVDRENGVVQIPIERAMELIVEADLSAATEGEPPNFGLSPAYRLDSSGGLQPVGGELLNSEGVSGRGVTPEGSAIEGGATSENGTNATTGENAVGGGGEAGNGEPGNGAVIDSEATDENAPEFESEGGGTSNDGSSDAVTGDEVTGDE